MKTAISLPDDLFSQAEKYAREQGLSRSELYATALRAYLEAHGNDDLIERINRACAAIDTALPTDLAGLARKKLLEGDW
jgi:metal-responsive CopG/Arc/MetJ family transcriptional regulator